MAEQRQLLVDYPGVPAGELLEKDAAGRWRGLTNPNFWVHDSEVSERAEHFAEPVLREITNNIVQIRTLGSLAVPTFVKSTVAQNAAAVRIAYQTATQLRAIMIGDFLSSLTDAQLRAAFGITQAQVLVLRTNKLTPAANSAASIRAAAGE